MDPKKSIFLLSINKNPEISKTHLSIYAKEIKEKILQNKQLENQIFPLNIQISLQKQKLSKLTKINDVSKLKSEIITDLTSSNLYLIDVNHKLKLTKNKLTTKNQKLLSELNISIENLNNQLTSLKDYNFIFNNKLKYKDAMIQKLNRQYIDAEIYKLNGGNFESIYNLDKEIDLNDEKYRNYYQEYINNFSSYQKKLMKKLRNYNKIKRKCKALGLHIKKIKDYIKNLDIKTEGLYENEINYEESENTNDSIKETNNDEIEKEEINLDLINNINNIQENKKINVPKLDLKLINYNLYQCNNEKYEQNSRKYKENKVTKKIKEMKGKIKIIERKNKESEKKCQKFVKNIKDLEKVISKYEEKKIIKNHSISKYSRCHNFIKKNENRFENRNKKIRFNNSTSFALGCNKLFQSSF